ncbi:DUF3239 domain-containing protein [Rhodococcus sp. ANT_H53B]|uniref:DUF3239 domain-containing protein n=1 Tax=Rhodococcus sp. ANT_H53B TaxID=2597357 RepID=UPI0011ED8F57|nr:DUF3239 domain-containing protein [Rhodococcus sp. ANT_H53B]KAA0927694.1 DUF3239 domain-containing protein [Rhodococcus sp. ANT_H53B]
MRKFEFPVDVAHAKSVNETFTELRRLRASAALTAVFLVALGAWFIWIAAPWSYILGAVFLIGAATSLWVMLWAPRKMGSIESQYAAGDLVPAVVAEKLPGGAILLALVDIAKPEVDEPHYVLITRVVRALPGHAVERGAQVPAVSVLADRGRNTGGRAWQLASVMPIAWGTTDPAVIARAAREITEGEWALLHANIGLSEKVRTAKNQQLLIDPADLPDDLR